MQCIYDFIINLSATAIGVFLGLILDKQREISKRSRETEEIKEKIKSELVDAIHTMKITRTRKNDLFLSPIKTPVFKAYVNSTQITLLDKYDWYENLLNLYKDIDDFNAWHNIRTEKSFDKENVMLEKIDDGLKIVEKLIIESVVIKEFRVLENQRSI